MKRLLPIAGLALVAAGCAAAAAPGSSATPHVYACDGGKRFTVAYAGSGDRAKVDAGGVTRSLPLARSGSGARYAARGMELWGKGATATLTGFPGGPYDGCATH